MSDRSDAEHVATEGFGHGRSERDVDVMLRAAGARLRDVGLADVVTPTHSESARRRWIAPAVLGAVAAATVAVLAVSVMGDGDESLQEVPSDSGPSVTTAPDTDPITTPDTGAPGTEPTVPTTTGVPGEERLPEVVVTSAGPGGAWCFELRVSATSAGGPALGMPGCVRESDLEAPRTFVMHTGELADESPSWLVRTMPGVTPTEAFTVEAGPARVCATDVASFRANLWVEEVACPSFGPGPILRILPVAATEQPSYEVLAPVTYGPVALTPVLAGDVAEGLQAFEATLDVGVEVRCLAIVGPSTSGWSETCRSSDEPLGYFLAVIDGAVYHVEWSDGFTRIVELDDDAPDRADVAPVTLWSNGCTEPVSDIVTAIGRTSIGLEMVMFSGIACAGDAASAAFGSVFLQVGPVDGGLVQLQRGTAGGWTAIDTGTGLEPDPPLLPVPPADDAVTRLGPSDLPPVDITEELRTDVGEAGSSEELLDRLVAALRGDPDEPPATVYVDGLVPFAVGLVTYLDDSIGSGTVAAWFTEVDGRFVIDRAFLVNRCSRGLTELDGQPACV